MHICETVTCLSYVTSRTFTNSVLESSKQILVSGSVQQPFVSQQNLFIFLKKNPTKQNKLLYAYQKFDTYSWVQKCSENIIFITAFKIWTARTIIIITKLSLLKSSHAEQKGWDNLMIYVLFFFTSRRNQQFSIGCKGLISLSTDMAFGLLKIFY